MTDRTDILELRNEVIKDIFLVNHQGGTTYIRFTTDSGLHFDVELDSMFDMHGNYFDIRDLNFRP